MITRQEPTPKEIRENGIYRTFGLSDSEYERIVELLGREPNYVETGIFSVMWSEHCSYKSSRAQFKKFPTSGPRVMQGPGENAGIVDIGDGYAVAFKMESHNHPSAIEPYQGAATGVGGIIRDIFTMGARPIALLNSLRFGTLHNNPRNKYLFENVVKGIAGYGNCIGIPTVGGEVVFDDRYTQNPLVNAMCVGLLRHDQIATGSAKGVSNPVMVVGAKTGRDGIHGATFASAEDPYSKERSAVQVGDPFMEKLLLEACLELIASGAVVGIQDMGAAGLTSSSSEMAARAGSGIELDMLLVPRREEGMTPYEIMLSESQERMLVVMKKGQEEVAERIFKKWGLDAVVIGRVTDDGCLRIREGNRVCAEIPVTHLVDEAPVYHRPSERPKELDQLQSFDPLAMPEPGNYTEILQTLLKRPTIASKEWVYRQYDSMVRTSTAVRPGSDAAVVVIRGTEKAIAMTTDGNGRYVFLDPFVGGQLAVAEAARNVVCSGAEPIAITDCLNFGNPEKPEIYYQFEKAIEGISEACRALETPVISGNVSFYNQTGGIDIYPTPIIGMVGLVSDYAHVTTQSFKQEGNLIYMTGETGNDLGGSEYLAAYQGLTAGKPPKLDLELEVRVQKFVLAAIRARMAQTAHDCSDGGLAVALAESCICGNKGAVIHLEGQLRKDVQLFAETPSRVLLEVNEEHQGLFEALAQEFQVPITLLGQVEGDSLIVAVNEEIVIDAEVEDLSKTWKGALACEMN